eukprot:1010060-Rhodomonas_salina.2
MAGNIAEAQSLLANPVASLDACVAEGDADDSDSDGEGGDEAGEMMMEEEKEPEQVELTAEQQADIDDGWGVVVKTTRGSWERNPPSCSLLIIAAPPSIQAPESSRTDVGTEMSR